MFGSVRLVLLALVLMLAIAQAPGHAQSAAAILQQSANAMGGPKALRALKTQVVESEGKQFDSSSTPQPLGPTRQITTFPTPSRATSLNLDCNCNGRHKTWGAIKPSALLKLSTAHHLDHAGGIRAFMAEGAAIVVPFNAQAFYAKVARLPHTRNPDSLERGKTAVVIEAFGGGHRVLSDGRARSRSIRSRPHMQKIW